MHNLSVLLPRGQSFCKKTDLLTALFLQLETRSPKGRNGCLPPGLEASEGLRQPPLEPDRKGLGKCEETGCERHPNSTSVAITALVPQTSGATGIMSPENQPSSGGGNGGRTTATSGTTLAVWPISGKTTLVRNFQGNLQTSYLHGDNNNLHNQTTPCAKNGSVSGPIEDVVNFLAHLFHDKYQYRSLNAYRSAIASMHTPVNQSTPHGV